MRYASVRIVAGMLAAVFLGGCQNQSSQPPNILLLVAEDLSPRLGFAGDPIAHTPALDELADRSVFYDHTFTTAGVCAPSRAALIMGQHQISFGAQHMRTTTGPLGPYKARPDPSLKAFPELLRRLGYFTYTDNKLDYQFSGIRAGSGPKTLWSAEGAAAHWRQRANGQPFFGLINFMQTHESGVMSVKGPALGITHTSTRAWRRAAGLNAPALTDPDQVTLPPYYPDLPAVRRDVARHYDNIRAMDRQVAAILTELEAAGLADSTVVIWTTDHGDGLPRAKRGLFDSGIRVPMLVYLPEKLRHLAPEDWQPGSTDTALVSFVDIAPTLLKLAGGQVHSLHHGRDFLHEPPRKHVFASRDRIDEVQDRQRALRDKRYKYIRSYVPGVAGGHALAYRDLLGSVRAMRLGFEQNTLTASQALWFKPTPATQLYDIKNDPHEINNLSGQSAVRDIERELAAALDDHLLRVGDTGAQPEVAMRAGLLSPAGNIPTTPIPTIEVKKDRVHLISENSASIRYQLNDGPWSLYTEPLDTSKLNNKTLRVEAVRYGFEASELIEKQF